MSTPKTQTIQHTEFSIPLLTGVDIDSMDEHDIDLFIAMIDVDMNILSISQMNEDYNYNINNNRYDIQSILPPSTYGQTSNDIISIKHGTTTKTSTLSISNSDNSNNIQIHRDEIPSTNGTTNSKHKPWKPTKPAITSFESSKQSKCKNNKNKRNKINWSNKRGSNIVSLSNHSKSSKVCKLTKPSKPTANINGNNNKNNITSCDPTRYPSISPTIQPTNYLLISIIFELTVAVNIKPTSTATHKPMLATPNTIQTPPKIIKPRKTPKPPNEHTLKVYINNNNNKTRYNNTGYDIVNDKDILTEDYTEQIVAGQVAEVISSSFKNTGAPATRVLTVYVDNVGLSASGTQSSCDGINGYIKVHKETNDDMID